MAVVITICFGYLIMKKRDDFTSSAIILVCLAFILSTFAGLLGGLVPLAYFTTRPLKGSSSEDESETVEGEQMLEAEPAQESVHENN
jgi:cytochrome bd-type quinol oxidase subunit 1